MTIKHAKVSVFSVRSSSTVYKIVCKTEHQPEVLKECESHGVVRTTGPYTNKRMFPKFDPARCTIYLEVHAW